MIVLLDSDVLSMATNPKASAETVECARWIKSLMHRNIPVRVPDIIDYELRRTLVFGEKLNGIRRLDELRRDAGYLELDVETILLASDLWALSMKSGRPLADEKALNADVILAAQAYMLRGHFDKIFIASGDSDLPFFDTTDVKTLPWRKIR